MYKEFREMSRTDAVEALYQDMAARHRARFGSIHVRQLICASLRTAFLTIVCRSSRSWRLPTSTASAAPTSSSSSRRTSSSLCLTALPTPARSCTPTAVPRPLLKCDVLGFWGWSVEMNNCYGHSMHEKTGRADTAYLYPVLGDG